MELDKVFHQVKAQSGPFCFHILITAASELAPDFFQVFGLDAFSRVSNGHVNIISSFVGDHFNAATGRRVLNGIFNEIDHHFFD
ncbi:hypothetical protein D3C87_1781300 [compost metagenome]